MNLAASETVNTRINTKVLILLIQSPNIPQQAIKLQMELQVRFFGQASMGNNGVARAADRCFLQQVRDVRALDQGG